MFHAFVSLIARGWKLFGHDDDVGNVAAATGRECKEDLLWFRDIGKFAVGDFSMAVIESGGFSTFIDVYDGHGGPDCSRYVCDNLFHNLQELLYKMVCEPDETDLNMHIPAVMLPLDVGTRLEKMLTTTSSVSVQLHLPLRPAVDVAEDASDELPNTKYASVSGVVNMNVKAAVLFVVFASCFLFMLYKLMSSWFIDVLVVLFCIGGIEGLQTCLVALLSRWFKHVGESYIKVPFLGAISLEYMPFLLSFFFFLNGGIWLLYVVLVRDVILGVSLHSSLILIVLVH
ncbi:Signal peptide peptidase-like 2 [Glycine soja]